MSDNLSKAIQTKTTQLQQLLFASRSAKRFNHLKQYFSPQLIAGYIGFLGYQNLGDEILYQSFQRLFPAFQLLAYDGAMNSIHNPPFSYYPIELALYRSWIKSRNFYNLVFLGGGTLINRQQYLSRFQHALQSTDRCVVFGTGVCNPQFWHERDSHEDYLNLIREWLPTLEQATSVQVRGPLSAKILEAYGLQKPDFISDPALSLCQPRSISFDRKGTIGVNVGSHGVLWGNQQQVEQTMQTVLTHLIDLGWRIELMPFHQSDLKLSRRLAQGFSSPHVSIWQDAIQIDQIAQTLERIQSYDLLIGQRLHSIVLAAGCAVPFIALSYAPKCDDFLASIGFQDFSIPTDQINLDVILELITRIEQNYDRHCQRLVEVGNYYRNVQYQAAQAITNSIIADLDM